MIESSAEPVPSCIICHHHRAEWGVCAGCVHRVDRQLADLLDLHALAGSIAALTRPTTGGQGSGSVGRTPPIPLHLAALDLAHGEWLLSTDRTTDNPPWTGLEGWEQDWRTILGLRPYGEASARRLHRQLSNAPRTRQASPGDTEGSKWHPDANRTQTATSATLTGVIGFLRAWWPQTAQRHPNADQFATDIHRMHAAATAALQLADARPWTVPCPAATDNGTDCGYRLRVDHDGRELVMRCPRCHSEWTLARLLLVAASAGRGVWVSTAEAAEHIGMHRSTIHRAIASGQIRSRYGRVDLLAINAWAATRKGTA